jgi:hypothetical protein
VWESVLVAVSAPALALGSVMELALVSVTEWA